MSKPSKRRCTSCGKPEKTRDMGGITLTSMCSHLGICVDCVNASLSPAPLLVFSNPLLPPYSA